MPKTKSLRTTMNVHVGRRFRKLTDDLVKAGRYASASDVVRAALRLLEDEERDRAEEIEAIRVGLADADAGRTRPAEEVFARVRREIEKRRK